MALHGSYGRNGYRFYVQPATIIDRSVKCIYQNSAATIITFFQLRIVSYEYLE